MPIFNIMCCTLAFPRLGLSCHSEPVRGVVQQRYNTGDGVPAAELQINIWEEKCHVMIALGISAC